MEILLNETMKIERSPGPRSRDLLTDLLRCRAQQMLATAKTHSVEPWAWCKSLIGGQTELGDQPPRDDLLPLLPATWLSRNPEARRGYVAGTPRKNPAWTEVQAGFCHFSEEK